MSDPQGSTYRSRFGVRTTGATSLYVSNRHNLHLAVALFERSGVTTQQAPGAYVPLSAHPDYRATLEAFDVLVV